MSDGELKQLISSNAKAIGALTGSINESNRDYDFDYLNSSHARTNSATKPKPGDSRSGHPRKTRNNCPLFIGA